jgi:hypothetical protein
LILPAFAIDDLIPIDSGAGGVFETELRAQPYLLAIFGNRTIAQQ